MRRLRQHAPLLPWLLGSLAMLGPFSIDTLFPAFRVLQAEFALDAVTVQQSVSVYLLTFALMALLHGPLSDAYGRRPVILVCLLIFLLASLGGVYATSFEELLVWRGVQGLSAGAGVIVGRAIIRDRFEGPAAQRLMSQTTLIFGIAPALAPIVGGWLLAFAGWRSIFMFLIAFALLALIISALALPETHPRARRQPLSLRSLLRGYAGIAADRACRWLVLAAMFNFGALFLYVASAPAFVMDRLGLSEQGFGWLFVPAIGGMMLGALLSGRLAGRLDPPRTVALGFWLVGAGALLNLAYNLAAARLTLPWAVLPIAVGAVGIAIVFPTLTLLMLDRFPLRRGAVSSVQSASSLAFNALLAAVIAPAVSGSGLWLATCAALLSLLALGCWIGYRRGPAAGPERVEAAAQ